MSSQLTNYQCPACTGPLHFVGDSGLLECDYSGSRYTPAEIEKLYKEKLDEAEQAAVQAGAAQAASAAAAQESGDEHAASPEAWNAEQDGMKLYNCPSCGAQLVCDATTAATSSSITTPAGGPSVSRCWPGTAACARNA